MSRRWIVIIVLAVLVAAAACAWLVLDKEPPAQPPPTLAEALPASVEAMSPITAASFDAQAYLRLQTEDSTIKFTGSVVGSVSDKAANTLIKLQSGNQTVQFRLLGGPNRSYVQYQGKSYRGGPEFTFSEAVANAPVDSFDPAAATQLLNQLHQADFNAPGQEQLIDGQEVYIYQLQAEDVKQPLLKELMKDEALQIEVQMYAQTMYLRSISAELDLTPEQIETLVDATSEDDQNLLQNLSSVQLDASIVYSDWGQPTVFQAPTQLFSSKQLEQELDAAINELTSQITE